MTGNPVSSLMRHDRALLFASLAAVAALAWTYLLLGAGIEMETMDMGGGQIMMMAPEWSISYAAIVAVMWAIMMIAMMLPSAAPVVLLSDALDRHRGTVAAARRSAFFLSGYLIVWFAFSLVATALQWALDEAGLLSETMAVSNRVLAGTTLVVAGLYQWTPLKQACLNHCRSPAEFLVRHSREARLVTGVRHGLFCLGCCWMLMALLFVGGLMNLSWIVGIAVLVLIEKTLPWGGWMSRIIGLVLVGWGASALAMMG